MMYPSIRPALDALRPSSGRPSAKVSEAGYHPTRPAIADAQFDVAVLVGREPVPGLRTGARMFLNAQDNVPRLQSETLGRTVRQYFGNANPFFRLFKADSETVFFWC